MMRLSASRSQRSKGGFRVKLVLQICLLLAICTWLLYQVKHSHDKKKAFEDKISQIASMEVSKQPHLFDLGRKSLPLLKEKDLTSDNHVKEDGNEEDEEGGEQEQEQDQDQDMKQEDTKDEDEFFSEEEKDGQVEEDDFDLQEEEGSAQEAREENYKRDDASSAVAHDSSMEIEDSKGNDLESSANGTVDVGMNNNNETFAYVAPPISTISNVSNASFGENITLINSDLSINGSHPTEVRQQNEENLANTTTPTTTITTTNLPVDNAFDNSSVAIQNGSKFDNSVSTREVSQLAKSGLIPVQDQNYKSDDHSLNSDLLTNGVKDSDDKAAE